MKLIDLSAADPSVTDEELLGEPLWRALHAHGTWSMSPEMRVIVMDLHLLLSNERMFWLSALDFASQRARSDLEWRNWLLRRALQT